MELKKFIKYISISKNHVKNIDYDTSVELYSAILNNEISDLELGGLLIALRIKGVNEKEILGFYHAMQNKILKLQVPSNTPMPIIIPSYNGARSQGNLTALLGLLLVKLGFPVLLHGVNVDHTRITTKEILFELGIEPINSRAQAQEQLKKCQLVFITIDFLCAPIEKQLLLRWRMGVRNIAHTLVKLATPFSEKTALRITSVSHPKYEFNISKFLQSIDATAIFLKGTEGEVYANPKQCPVINIIHRKNIRSHFQKKIPSLRINLPISKSAQDTARWINDILSGEIELPYSLKFQLACCLIATKESSTFEEAEERLKKIGI